MLCYWSRRLGYMMLWPPLPPLSCLSLTMHLKNFLSVCSFYLNFCFEDISLQKLNMYNHSYTWFTTINNVSYGNTGVRASTFSLSPQRSVSVNSSQFYEVNFERPTCPDRQGNGAHNEKQLVGQAFHRKSTDVAIKVFLFSRACK